MSLPLLSQTCLMDFEAEQLSQNWASLACRACTGNHYHTHSRLLCSFLIDHLAGTQLRTTSTTDCHLSMVFQPLTWMCWEPFHCSFRNLLSSRWKSASRSTLCQGFDWFVWLEKLRSSTRAASLRSPFPSRLCRSYRYVADQIGQACRIWAELLGATTFCSQDRSRSCR